MQWPENIQLKNYAIIWRIALAIAYCITPTTQPNGWLEAAIL